MRLMSKTEYLIVPKGMKFMESGKLGLKVLATIPYFKFYFFPHLVIFLQFRDPSYVLNLSTKTAVQKWHFSAREPNICSLN